MQQYFRIMIRSERSNSRFRKANFIVVPAFLWLAGTMVLAQEAGEGAEQETATRYSVLYLEPAVPVGEEIDFELPPPEIPRSPELDPEFEERMQDIQRFDEAITDSEILAGAWGNSLVEQLNSLGSLQQQQGDHLGAIETHERAIHVQRINSGLHTIDQAPLVEQMIDSFIAMGDWTQVDVYQNYLFYIQQKFYGNDDPRLIPALGDLADWHTRAFNMRQGESLAMRLSSAQMLFKAAARMVEVHFGPDDERYIEYLRGVARSAYLVALNQDLLRELARAQFRAPQETLRDMLYWHVPIVPTGFRAGEDALLAIRDYYVDREGAAEQLAEATAHVADWYLLFNRRAPARDMYLEAWEAVAEEENADELRLRLFGQVREIPVFAADDNGWMIENMGFAEDFEVEEVSYNHIDLRFDVTQWGEVRNIETVGEAAPETESQQSWVRRNVRDSMFRPMLVDGENVRSDGNLFRFRYWY